MTGPQHPEPPAGDGLSAARTRAAELGVSVAEYVRDQLRRTRAEEAWERALAEAGARQRTAADLRAAIGAANLPPLDDTLADDIESALEALRPSTDPWLGRD